MKSIIIVSGDEAPLQVWLNNAVARGSRIVEDRHDGGKRHTSVLLPSNTAYRTIGALIYSGQASGLTVTMKTEPPICGAEAN